MYDSHLRLSRYLLMRCMMRCKHAECWPPVRNGTQPISGIQWNIPIRNPISILDPRDVISYFLLPHRTRNQRWYVHRTITESIRHLLHPSIPSVSSLVLRLLKCSSYQNTAWNSHCKVLHSLQLCSWFLGGLRETPRILTEHSAYCFSKMEMSLSMIKSGWLWAAPVFGMTAKSFATTEFLSKMKWEDDLAGMGPIISATFFWNASNFWLSGIVEIIFNNSRNGKCPIVLMKMTPRLFSLDNTFWRT